MQIRQQQRRRAIRTSRFDSNELSVEGVSNTSDDLVLHLEEISHRLFEPFCPKVTAALGINQLYVDPHTTRAALDASFERVPDVQFAPYLRDVKSLAFCSCRQCSWRSRKSR